MLKKAVLATLLFSMFLFFVCDIAQARDKYDTELLSRQMQFHHLEKADEYIKNGDYLNAAITALSIYPIDSSRAVYKAVSLEGKVDKPLPQFLFEAFQECVASDPSLRYMKGDKKMFNAVWMDQKAKWSDDLIAEVAAYQQIKKHLNNDENATNEFFFGAFHNYYKLDKEKSMLFAKDFDQSSFEYRILKIYTDATLDKPIDIDELEKIDINGISKAMKELVINLKVSYYMDKEDVEKSKEACLQFFELEYSLPVHIENLATCYIATGSYEEAKPLLLYLTHLYQADNISSTGLYNLACIFGREDNKEKAIRYLKAAIERGFPKSHAKDDEDLQSLRNDKRFIELVN